MAKHRDALPQLGDEVFLTDGGIETTLVFHHGLDLPHFAAFDLLKDSEGVAALRRYYAPYLELATARGRGFILESPTWRASSDWGERLGYTRVALAEANRRSIALMAELRDGARNTAPVVISGCVGPRGDGYRADERMSAAAAADYHGRQVGLFAETDADMVAAITMTYPDEAIGVARAARSAGMPVAISFTVETDERLPSGHALGEAINAVDEATAGGPAYYMLNCAHPTHFVGALDPVAGWAARVRGLRANASKQSHTELDAAPELDDGDPVELGAWYAALRHLLPLLTVLGGCCGTDHRHVDAICRACSSL